MPRKKRLKNQMNVLEMLSKHIRRIEEFEATTSDQDILVSSQYKVKKLREDFGIQKTPIVWPLYRHNMFFVVEVPPNTKVPAHVHIEDVFRYVVKGSLVINDKVHVSEGEWFVIKAGVRYKILSESGYVAISGYTSVCHTGRGFKEAPEVPFA